MKKIEIIPAILPDNFTEIATKTFLVENIVKLVQIDICDGKLTSKSTWPYLQGTLPIFNDDFEMPSWDKLDFELDLMIQNPQNYIDNLKNLGCCRAVLHLKSSSHEGLLEAALLLDQYAIEVGIAITNDSNLDDLHKLVKLLDDKDITVYLQVMGIQHPGKQGQAFDQRTITTLQSLRSKYPDIDLQVDGSVNDKTIPELIEAGANRLVIGSWFFSEQTSAFDKMQIIKNLIY